MSPKTQLIYKENIKALLKQQLGDDYLIYSSQIMNGKRLDEKEFKYLVTLDLEGFEQQTITGMPVFNLLHGRQVHVLLSEQMGNEKCLSERLSLMMSFLCTNEMNYRRIKEKYENIPYLYLVDGWKENLEGEELKNNVKLLSQSIKNVVSEF